MNDAQLATMVSQALPGSKLHTAQPLGARTLLLTLGDRRRVVLRQTGQPDEWAGEPVTAEARALRALRAEIDLPLPELLAYEPAGDAAGAPYALLSYVEGRPLPEVLPELNEDQRYAIGRGLGAIMLRVHSRMVPDYGALPADDDIWSLEQREPSPEKQRRPRQARRVEPARPPEPHGSADRDYLAARLTRALDTALHAGELDASEYDQVQTWLGAKLLSYGQRASLVHGDLRPECVLVRRRERNWQISGVLGWGYAQAWRPGWDHTVLLEACAGQKYFGVRVGYGTAYDDAVERTYDQLRHLALMPYRIVLYLEAGRADLALNAIQATTEFEREGGTIPFSDDREETKL